MVQHAAPSGPSYVIHLNPTPFHLDPAPVDVTLRLVRGALLIRHQRLEAPPVSCQLPPASCLSCPRGPASTGDCQMSPPPTFLRVPHRKGPVLVRVAPRSSTKSLPLDLELRATDNVRAFVLPRKSGPSHPLLSPVIYSLQVARANLARWAASGPASRPRCGPSSSCSLTHPMCLPVQPPRPAPGPSQMQL